MKGKQLHDNYLYVCVLLHGRRLLENLASLADNASGSDSTDTLEEMTMRYRMMSALFVALLLVIKPAYAAFDDELSVLQQHWASARYQASGDERKKQLEKMAEEANSFTKKYSDKAESYLWAAVIKASLAEAINNLSALSIAKDAKANLEKSIELDPKAEDSYAYGMLGAMYARAPGWPVAFGDDKKAREMLKKGVELAPNGMNVNYFNAQYYFDKDEYQKALPYIEKAAQATPPYPPDKSLAVSNRQREIQEMSEKIKAKLK